MKPDQENRSTMDELLGQAMGHDLPEEVRSKMRRQLDEFRLRMETDKPAPGFWDRALSLPIWAKIVPIVAVSCALLVVGYLILGNPSGVALADVIRRVREARTMQYTLFVEANGITSPKAQYFVLEPGRVRSVMSENGVERINITDAVGRRMLTLLPAQKKATLITTDDAPPRTPTSPFGILEQIREIQGRARNVLPIRHINGRKVRGFVCEKQGSIWTIWADVQTCDLVRVDVERALPTPAKMTLENFVCNADLDESLFSTVPPPGYALEEKRVSMPRAVESDLIEGLRYAAAMAQGHFPGEISMSGIGQYAERYGMKELLAKDINAGMKVGQALMFVQFTLTPKQGWKYFGDRVTLGEAEKPLCWWRKTETAAGPFRVVYGDLSARDVPEAELPPVPGPLPTLPKTN